MPRHIHLIGFLINSPIDHTILSWADPRDRRVAGLGSVQYWQDLARLYEKGGFDAVFFADIPATFDSYRDRTDETVRYGICWPNHDPIPLLGIMAGATRHLGLATTMSITSRHPYTAVRELSTLDYVTGGRVGWNIVTGHLRAEYRALGLEHEEHDARYDRADEYIAMCKAFWVGIAPDAINANLSQGWLADPAKVKTIDMRGAHYATHAVSPVLPSAQGRPVLFQAGSSGRGQRFAATHADVIFAIQPHLEGMKAIMAQFRTTAESVGRMEPTRVTFAVQTIIGGTEAEANRRQRDIEERIPIEAGLARLSGTMGIDFHGMPLDQPFAELPTQASQGMMKAMAGVLGTNRFTLRDAAMRWGVGVGMPRIVGTPEQVAAELETIWRETGCIGFNLSPTDTPANVAEFVDHVVPLLRRRNLVRPGYTATTLRGNLIEE